MNIFTRIGILMLCFSLPAYAQLPEGWEWQNPLPHGLTIYDIAMLDEYHVIAGCENGYIMLSNDGGDTWVQTRVTGGTIYHVASTDSRNVWIVSEEGTILHSSDFGRTWETQLQLQTTQSGATTIQMYDDQYGMATLPRDRVFRTSNGGTTWEEITAPYFGQDYARWLAAKSLNSWYILGTIGSSPRLYRTTDFGTTWYTTTEFDTRGLNNLVFIDTLDGFQCRNGELLRTTNGGETWDEMDIFGFGYVTDIEAGARLGDRLFALSEGSVVVNASYDNGENWNVSLLENAFGYASPTAMDFATPFKGIIAGSGGRILRTSDGGQSWNIVHGIGFLGHITDVAFTDPNHGIALTATPTILLSTNGGERWIESIPLPDITLQGISMYNETSGYAYGTTNSETFYMYHTSDVGSIWELRGKAYEVTTDDRYIIPQAILADSETRVYLGLSYGRLFRSTDGGMSFDSLGLPRDLDYQYYSSMNLQTFPPDYVTLMASNGVAQSTDGGDTWVFHNVPNQQWLRAGMFTSPQRGYSIQNGNFSRSLDGGFSWEQLPNENNELLYFFDDANGVMYSTQYASDEYKGSIKWTHDGGDTWSEHSLRERVAWDDWFWLSPENAWAFGYGGMIRHSGSEGVVGIRPLPQRAATLSIHSTYPNPVTLSANNGISVDFSISQTSSTPLRLTLHDALGRVLSSMEIHQMQSGRNIVTIPASQLPQRLASSFLVLTISQGTQRVSSRITVLK